MFRQLVVVFCILCLIEQTFAACSFYLDQNTSGRHVPLVLKSLKESIDVPLLTGYVTLQNRQKIYLLCSGRGNFLKPDFGSLVTATCHNGNFILNSDSQTTYEFDDLECQKLPQSEAADSFQACNTHYKKILIGFRVSSSIFISKLELCFDSNKLTTYWSKHTLQTPDIGEDNKKNKISKEEEHQSFQRDYFTDPNPGSAYYKTGYDRGHLIPQSDFFTKAEKKMTFYYINAVPQIADFNRNNWKTLEGAIRGAAFRSRKYLTVYTGTAGTKSYLSTASEKLIPVPEYFWKIIIDQTNGDGVAFVGVNDIANNIPNPCGRESDVCSKIKWLKGKILTNRNSLEKGKIYCCTIKSFRTINGLELPQLSEFSGELLQYL